MQNEINEGGCYCGNIRYAAIVAPKFATICYCNDCRRIAGSQSVAWLTFPFSKFKFERGEPVIYQSSENVIRTFCGICGTCLTYQNKKREMEIDVTISSMDDPEKYPPRKLVFADSKLKWDAHLDLPKSEFTGQ